MTLLSLQPANANDLPVFMELERAPDAAHFVLPDTPEEHRRLLDDPKVVYQRIAIGDRTYGFLVIGLDPDEISVEFRRIVVETKGVGIGRLAIERMHRLCRDELARSRVWLDVFDYNVRARHLYEKLRYRPIGQRDMTEGRLITYEKWL